MENKISSLGYVGMFVLGACIGSYTGSRHSDLDTAQIFRDEKWKDNHKNL